MAVMIARITRGQCRDCIAYKLMTLLNCTMMLPEFQQIIDVLMQLLRYTFGDSLRLEDLYQPQHYTTLTITRLTYRLLEQIMKGNPDNRKWLSSAREIRFLETQVG
jgi:hypothetical protein